MTIASTSWIRHLLVRDLDGLRSELELFRDESLLWSTPPGISNSAGTLALHLCGNLQHYVGAVLGNSGYVRNRDQEFSRRNVGRAELVAEIETTSRVVRTVLSERTDDLLLLDYPEELAGTRFTTGLFLQHLSTHLAMHLGQVGYLRRMLTGDGTSAGPVSLQALAVAAQSDWSPR